MTRLTRCLFALFLTALLGACAAGGGTRAPLAQDEGLVQGQPVGVDLGRADGNDAPLAIGDAPALALADVPVIPADADADAQGDVPADEALLPTEAERDFAAIYGGTDPYDPVADPSLPAPAELGAAYDPWEGFNRRMHALNNLMDRAVGLPLAQAYVAAVPTPVRHGIGNFFLNLGQPVSALNALLQGRPLDAAESLARFLVNSTVGVAGVFDPATRWGIAMRSEDFGQTLAVWGWERSRYLELPLFGPRTLRDVFGMAGDAPLSPMHQIPSEKVRFGLQGLMLVDIRTQLMSVDAMRAGVADEYALVRDAWMQRRNYQIHGDRRQRDEALPDYLQEEEQLPMLPADVLPVPLPGLP